MDQRPGKCEKSATAEFRGKIRLLEGGDERVLQQPKVEVDSFPTEENPARRPGVQRFVFFVLVV